MEQYLWMAIGSVIVGFFAKTYWDVYTAYRAYIKSTADITRDLISPPVVTAPRSKHASAWLINKVDRFLHALLMSPISR